MNIDTVLERLHAYQPPENWGGHIFLLPEQVMRDIYQLILDQGLTQCLELGTGFGATSCAICAALEERGEGQLTTVDKYFHQPVNVQVLMEHVGLDLKHLNIVADELGYNWYMSDLLKTQQEENTTPIFDFCLLDGAHEWEPDALAFTLVNPLLKPGAWMLVDDLDFKLRMIPNWQESHGNHSDRELDTFQMRMVYDLVVKQHPEFEDFNMTHNERIGWARKKAPRKESWLKRLLGR